MERRCRASPRLVTTRQQIAWRSAVPVERRSICFVPRLSLPVSRHPAGAPAERMPRREYWTFGSAGEISAGEGAVRRAPCIRVHVRRRAFSARHRRTDAAPDAHIAQRCASHPSSRRTSFRHRIIDSGARPERVIERRLVTRIVADRETIPLRDCRRNTAALARRARLRRSPAGSSFVACETVKRCLRHCSSRPIKEPRKTRLRSRSLRKLLRSSFIHIPRRTA